MSEPRTALSRRAALRLLAGSAALGLTTGGLSRVRAESGPQLRTVAPQDRRFLFIVCAYGGASIIDSFLPVAESAVGDFFLSATLNSWPDGMIEQKGAFRTPKILDDYGIYGKPTYAIGDFVTKHGKDLAVVTQEVSSVNHTVGQQRSLSGAGVYRGRTLMEMAALRYGGGLPIPSCNMASDGYLRHGADTTLPPAARHELITAPTLFAAGTSGSRGVADLAPDFDLARARSVRDALEQSSVFGQTFAADARRNKFLTGRASTSKELERLALYEKLFLFDAKNVDPKYGVSRDPVAEAVRSALPDLDRDKLEAQVGLGFLLAYHGVSTCVTLGLSTDPYFAPDDRVLGSPIAFDFSHQAHRAVQSLMWSRTLSTVDKLITLLKTYDFMGDPALGKMWDRSLVYIATEFGRDKERPFLSGSWGTGHHLNNGVALISPLLRGGAVYGGVDPRTCLTFGFDPASGAATPGKNMGEADVLGIISQALDLGAEGVPRYDAVVRG